MIKLGMCADVKRIREVEEIGFDYIEPSLTALAALSESEFESVCALVDGCKIKAEAFNGMLPGDLKVVGDDVNAQKIHDYLDLALPRAKRLGAKVVVFGSGRSRAVPEGFDTGMAWRQIGNYLRMAQRHALENDIMIAIEPLRTGECNILNYVSEATLIASLIQMSQIGVLGDTYHMAMGGESFSALTMAGTQLKHVHTANAIGRKFPKPNDGERYAELFETLKGINYEGRVSVEGGYENFSEEAPDAHKALVIARG